VNVTISILHKAVLGIAAIALSTAPATAIGQTAAKPNVLLILVDDLKPVMGCYGDPVAQTPNMDRLAAQGMRFELNYANQAVCGPSRFNLMLGSRSSSTGLYGLGNNLREFQPDAVTLPQYFSRHGWTTESLGKVFHIGHGNQGDPESFQLPHFKDKVIEYVLKESTGGMLTREEAYFENVRTNVPNRQLPRGAAWERADVPDEAYADGRVAAEAVRRLEGHAKDRSKPFLMAVGFARPHMPFTAPQKYWALYDPAKLPLPDYTQAPKGAPNVALKHGGEITQYTPVPESGDIDEALTRQLIHGYYASMSYADAQIGRVLTALRELKLEENTIVLLWGDNGFHLGDHSIWTKHTDYEQATRIPLIIVAPGVTQPGTVTRQLSETVDIYPTLAELAGLPRPAGPQPIDGTSLVPVLRNPSARVRDYAYMVWPKDKIGRAIRTERYRFVEWKAPGEPAETAELELYDYLTDPLETENLASRLPQVVTKLRSYLAEQPEALERPAGRRLRNARAGN